jgi:hypothetical protein
MGLLFGRGFESLRLHLCPDSARSRGFLFLRSAKVDQSNHNISGTFVVMICQNHNVSVSFSSL